MCNLLFGFCEILYLQNVWLVFIPHTQTKIYGIFNCMRLIGWCILSMISVANWTELTQTEMNEKKRPSNLHSIPIVNNLADNWFFLQFLESSFLSFIVFTLRFFFVCFTILYYSKITSPRTHTYIIGVCVYEFPLQKLGG